MSAAIASQTSFSSTSSGATFGRTSPPTSSHLACTKPTSSAPTNSETSAFAPISSTMAPLIMSSRSGPEEDGYTGAWMVT